MSQDKNVDDVCEACGTIVELGSVIAEDDTVLILPFTGEDKVSVEQLAQKYIDAAKARFATVEVSTQENSDENGVHLEVSLRFECTAEKLIFQLHEHHIFIPQIIEELRNHLNPENLAGAEELSYGGHRDQNQAVSCSVSQSIHKGHPRCMS